jgi:hypothetical protein
MSALGDSGSSASSPPSGGFPNISGVVQGFITTFEVQAHAVVVSVDGLAIYITALLILPFLAFGLLLYLTHWQKRLGWRLIWSGVGLAIVWYAIFPYLISIAPAP